MRWRSALVSVVLTSCGTINYEPSSLTYRDVVMEDSPLAYWRLGDDGDIAHDETGRSDGTYAPSCATGAPGAIPEDSGSAVLFDGMSCEISLQRGLEFAGLSPFSLEVWVSVASSEDYNHFITRQTRIRPGGRGPEDGYALLQLRGAVYLERAVSGSLIKTPQISITANRFTHVVGTYDGMTLRLYIDGALVGEAPDPRETPAFETTPLLGSHMLGAYFDGVMDEVAVYDHALTAERIALHHRIGAVGAH